MRRFAFLSCHDCLHFTPCRGSAPVGPASLAFLGVCRAGERPEWVVWESLDHAAQEGGRCPDHERRPRPDTDCRLFEATAESLRRAYPESCLHRGTPACRRADPARG